MISKSAYCLLVPLLFWAFNSVPRPATALFHVATLPLLSVLSPDQLAAQYMTVSRTAP
ncbi:hypothetical protein IscW_ISCW012397 [Ixodes scapularis]|uniref:Secreted protein n=1 Tax=Ixodes scapularis TaxID=6945 RepID=B7QE07_IXOSC|nr:hypothetical protein IscW_ISCW012397 [Ixodes scapularis]|eukprot:XP_002413771.1 hypothetical protein IscW_ISCW012397 [Ixodes scapularis]